MCAAENNATGKLFMVARTWVSAMPLHWRMPTLWAYISCHVFCIGIRIYMSHYSSPKQRTSCYILMPRMLLCLLDHRYRIFDKKTTSANGLSKKITYEIFGQKRPPLGGGKSGQLTRNTCYHWHLPPGTKPARCLDLTRDTCTPYFFTCHLGMPDLIQALWPILGNVPALSQTTWGNGGICHVSVG
jgi:hypothetical protein